MRWPSVPENHAPNKKVYFSARGFACFSTILSLETQAGAELFSSGPRPWKTDAALVDAMSTASTRGHDTDIIACRHANAIMLHDTTIQRFECARSAHGNLV